MTSLGRRHAVARLAAVVAVVGSAACGVPGDDKPRTIAAERLPDDLAAIPTTSMPAEVPGRTSVRIYFIAEDRLQAVHREVAERSPSSLWAALRSGPIADAATGVRTAIPQGLDIVGTPELFPDGLIVVELTEQITLDIEGAEQKRAFAQIVYTLTELRGVSAVRFRVGEVDLEVTTDGGSSAGPVRRRDFASLAPPVEPATTTTREVP